MSREIISTDSTAHTGGIDETGRRRRRVQEKRHLPERPQPLEREYGTFFQNPFPRDKRSLVHLKIGVDTLKDSVITSAELLIKNAEQQRDRELKQAREQMEEIQKREEEAAQKRAARIQAGIGWVTVLAVFSAWIDAYDFFGKFSPDMDDGWRALMQYPALFTFEVLMASVILLVGVIAIVYAAKAWQDTTEGKEESAQDSGADPAGSPENNN